MATFVGAAVAATGEEGGCSEPGELFLLIGKERVAFAVKKFEGQKTDKPWTIAVVLVFVLRPIEPILQDLVGSSCLIRLRRADP